MNKIWWKKIHNVLGLSSALFLTVLLMTGILLNHPSVFNEKKEEVIELDPTEVGDFKVENYDGATAAANLVFTEYVNRFKPGRLSMGLDAEEEGGRFADLTGAADAYYIMPEAG